MRTARRRLNAQPFHPADVSTREMLREATAAGHFETPHHGAVPKIQILTVEDLLAGKRPHLPDLSRGEQTFKKARTEDARADQPKLF